MSITRNAKALSLAMLVACSAGTTFSADFLAEAESRSKLIKEVTAIDLKAAFIYKHFGYDAKEARPYWTTFASVVDTADVCGPALFGVLGAATGAIKVKELYSNNKIDGKLANCLLWPRTSGLKSVDDFAKKYSLVGLITTLGKKCKLSENQTAALGALAVGTGMAASYYGLSWLTKKLVRYVSFKEQFNKDLINFMINWRNGERYENNTPTELHKTFNDAQAKLIENLKAAGKEYKDLDAAKDHKLVAKVAQSVKKTIDAHLANIRTPKEAK